MQKPSKRHKLASDNIMIKFKKPVHDPFKAQENRGQGQSIQNLLSSLIRLDVILYIVMLI